MFHNRIRSSLSVLAAAVGCCGIVAATAVAQPPDSINIAPAASWQLDMLEVNGSATCTGGGLAEILLNSSDPILKPFRKSSIYCDGAPHDWSDSLWAATQGPVGGGSNVTATLQKGSAVIASRNQQVYAP